MAKASSEGLSYFDQLPCPLALMDEKLGLLWTNDVWNSSVENLRRSTKEAQSETSDFIGEIIHSVIWIEHFHACLKGERRSFQDETAGVSLIWRMAPATLPYLRSKKNAVWIFFQPEWGLLPEALDQRMNLVQQAKLKELGELAASIAHEVNNPLAVIYARASFLKERMSKNQFTTEMALENLEKICVQSNRIVKIIRGLRNFSRDSSRDPFSLVQLSYLIDDATALVNEAIRNNGIELKIHNDGCEDLVFECRPTQILQVIVNLLKNAIEAVAHSQFPKVEISLRPLGSDRVEIQIRDNGPGVPEHLQSKIFHPFFTTKEIGVGTGLGLSVSLKIIESHNGKLLLDTKQGPSCFVIQLPIKQVTSTRAI
jgi:signal transduction histidine kinase